MADIQRRAAHLSCTQASSALLDHPTMSSNIVVMYGTYFSYAPSLHPPLVPSADPGPASPLPGLLLFGAHRLDPSGCVIDGQAVEFVCFGVGRVGSRAGVTAQIGGCTRIGDRACSRSRTQASRASGARYHNARLL